MRPRVPVLATLAVSLIAAGCGSTSVLHHKTSRSSRHPGSSRTSQHAAAAAPTYTLPKKLTIPAPPPTGIPATAAEINVVKGWTNALRAGHVDAAANYFAFPSAFINGVGVGGIVQATVIHNLAQSEQVNESLDCGATFISADQRGRYINVLFRLGGRAGPGGSNCGGLVSTARTNFLISRGKIVEWIRAPSQPGDNGGTGTGPSPAPTSTLSQVPVV
jgi:hypothetical protein